MRKETFARRERRGSWFIAAPWSRSDTGTTRSAQPSAFAPPQVVHQKSQFQEMAVWSGDIVKTDEEGFLYYVGRRDDMIKTSGYRVSSTEIEEVIVTTGLVEEAVAIGVPHPTLGQGIIVVAKPKGGGSLAQAELLAACRRDLPLYMVPALFVERTQLPRNPNGKIDRPLLARELGTSFQNEKEPDEKGATCTPR